MRRQRRHSGEGIGRGLPVGGDAGFTLIETMLAVVLMAVGLIAVAGVYSRGLVASVYGQDQTEAASLAQRWVEDLKNGPTTVLASDAGDYGTLTSLYFDRNANATTQANAVFTVDLQVQYWTWNSASGQYIKSATPYTAPGSGPYVYRVSAATHWKVNGGTVFTSGHLSSPNGCVVGGVAVPVGTGCVQISTFVAP